MRSLPLTGWLSYYLTLLLATFHSQVVLSGKWEAASGNVSTACGAALDILVGLLLFLHRCLACCPHSHSFFLLGFSGPGALTLFTLNFIKLFFILQLLLSSKLAEHRIREKEKEQTFYLTLQLSCAWLCSTYAKYSASSSPFSFPFAFLP